MLLSELRLSVEKLHDAANDLTKYANTCRLDSVAVEFCRSAANAYRNTARCLEQNAQQLTEVNDA